MLSMGWIPPTKDKLTSWWCTNWMGLKTTMDGVRANLAPMLFLLYPWQSPEQELLPEDSPCTSTFTHWLQLASWTRESTKWSSPAPPSMWSTEASTLAMGWPCRSSWSSQLEPVASPMPSKLEPKFISTWWKSSKKSMGPMQPTLAIKEDLLLMWPTEMKPWNCSRKPLLLLAIPRSWRLGWIVLLHSFMWKAPSATTYTSKMRNCPSRLGTWQVLSWIKFMRTMRKTIQSCQFRIHLIKMIGKAGLPSPKELVRIFKLLGMIYWWQTN